MTARPAALPASAGSARDGQPQSPRMARIRRIGLPYLLLLPALVFELLVHLIPMVVGVFISFKQLTQFYLVNWRDAPWALPATSG